VVQGAVGTGPPLFAPADVVQILRFGQEQDGSLQRDRDQAEERISRSRHGLNGLAGRGIVLDIQASSFRL
jgi:hypothetical protein